jgi:hypothetical protein
MRDGDQTEYRACNCHVSLHIIALTISQKSTRDLRVGLVHWHAAEAIAVQERLRAAGFTVEHKAQFDSAAMQAWRLAPPMAFVIDLSRMPSHGREVAIALRQSPKTKHTPIVFCDGALEKVKMIHELLPDATYCSGEDLVESLRIVRPIADPAKPADMMNRYGSRTTAQKLGIKAGNLVALINAPRNLSAVLGKLPEGVEFVEDGGAVTLCFLHSPGDLRAEISSVRRRAPATKLWILWRKKSAAKHDGITETHVRETSIDLGLVDYKICSVDETWSAMLFARRK